MSYYTAPGTPGLRDPLSSEAIRDEFTSLQQAFSLLPNPIGGGVQGFNGGVWTNGTLQAAVLQACRLGLNTAPSFGSVSYLTFAPINQPTLGAGNRAWTRKSNGDLAVQDDSSILFMVDNAGNVVVGNGTTALATTATSGFLYVRSGAGAPTGVPTVYSGAVPLYADTTNNRLYCYMGGAWRLAALT
jgi:hypothetical protein